MLLDKIVSEQCEYTGMILNIRTEVEIKKVVGRNGGQCCFRNAFAFS